ncbi:MAG: hypothetical protein JWP66_1581 [Naasia sp.]|nr:hypothetical protein [Naasia sp.]
MPFDSRRSAAPREDITDPRIRFAPPVRPLLPVPSGAADRSDAVPVVDETPTVAPPAPQYTGPVYFTGPQAWATVRKPRPAVTRSRTGITLSAYRRAPDEQVSSPEALRSLRLAAPGIVRTAAEIVDIEGPMPLQRLITLVARRFGIPRLDPQRRFHLGRVVGPQFRVIDDFVWPSGVKPATWRGARSVGDPNERRITDISRQELQNAMEFVLGETDSLPREQLLLDAAELLGYPKIPGPMRAWIVGALAEGVVTGRFRETDGAVSLV